MERYILDRLEEDWAVMEGESGSFLEIRKDALPPDSREGDVFYRAEDAWVSVPEEAQGRAARIRQKMNRLWKKEK